MNKKDQTEMIMIMALNNYEVIESLLEIITEIMKAVEENLVALVEAFLLNLKRAVSEVVQEVLSVEDSVEVQVVVDSEMVLMSAPVEVLL